MKLYRYLSLFVVGLFLFTMINVVAYDDLTIEEKNIVYDEEFMYSYFLENDLDIDILMKGIEYEQEQDKFAVDDIIFKEYREERSTEKGVVYYVPGEIVVGYKKGFDDSIEAKNLDVSRKIDALNLMVLNVKAGDEEKKIEKLSSRDDVYFAEKNVIYSYNRIPNDPYYGSYQWGPKNIKCSSAWSYNTGSSNVVVAILDSGVDYDHFDIAGNIWTNYHETPGNGVDDDNNGYIDDVHGWDFENNDNDPSDNFGHGTHCAGIAGAVTNNNVGVAGVSWKCRIMPVKIGSYGISTTAAADGIYYAANNGADVISMSWGGMFPSTAIRLACSYAYYIKKVFLCAASGNEYWQFINYPAQYSTVAAVGAIDQFNKRCDFSNYGYKLEFSAPGVDILSLRAENTDMYGGGGHIVDTYYYLSSGTSMACPHVAGVAALYFAKYSSGFQSTGYWCRKKLQRTADDLGRWGWDKYYGYGRIDATLK